MSNSIHEFDRLMLDYLKGDITPEDRQRMTELLHKDASCREKYREMSRAYAIASVPWFERRKKQNLDFLREKLDLRSSGCSIQIDIAGQHICLPQRRYHYKV